MAAQGKSIFTFPTSKRSACDRCRKQKLRCPSRTSEAQPCSRCTRAGVECITGYTRPLGRSRRVSYGSTNNDNLGQSHFIPVARPRLPHRDTELQSTSFSHTTTRPIQTVLAETSMETASSPSCLFSEAAEDFGSFSYRNVLDDLAGGPTFHLNQSYNAAKIDNTSKFLSLSPQYLELSEETSSSRSTSGDDTPSTFPPENVLSRALSRVNCDLRLAQLSVDLCRQAQRIMAGNEQSDGVQTGKDRNLTLVGTEPQHLSGCHGTSDQSKEFGDALCSTSEFMAIIQSMEDDMCLDHPTTKHEAHWPLANVSWVMNLMSCYLRIVAVFERLVLRLYCQMTCNVDEAPSSDSFSASHLAGPQTLPGLCLASFHVQQTNLQTKILVQIIEHQFEMIEKSLGLPIELRVSSDQREPYEGGILQSGMNGALLQAVITRLCTSPAAASSVEEPLVPGSLASLRENIINVRRLLTS